jgi:hypothetical protein
LDVREIDDLNAFQWFTHDAHSFFISMMWL